MAPLCISCGVLVLLFDTTTLQPDRAKRQHPGVCTLHDSGFTFELEHLNRYVLCGLHIMHACKQVYIHTHVHPGANTHLGARGGASQTHNVCVCSRARRGCMGACVRACHRVGGCVRGWVRMASDSIRSEVCRPSALVCQTFKNIQGEYAPAFRYTELDASSSSPPTS